MTIDSLRSEEAPTHLSDTVQTFTLVDPRSLDGDPFDVAERAVRQAEALTRLLAQSINGARLMARNAQLERELLQTGECDAPAYDLSAEGRSFDALSDTVKEIERKLGVLARAAGFNPKAPLGPA